MGLDLFWSLLYFQDSVDNNTAVFLPTIDIMLLACRTAVTLLQAPRTEKLGKDGEKGNRRNSEKIRTEKGEKGQKE